MNESAEQSPDDETIDETVDETNSVQDSKSADDNDAIDESSSGGGWKLRLSVLCAMLVLALAGMGFSQASEQGAWVG